MAMLRARESLPPPSHCSSTASMIFCCARQRRVEGRLHEKPVHGSLLHNFFSTLSHTTRSNWSLNPHSPPTQAEPQNMANNHHRHKQCLTARRKRDRLFHTLLLLLLFVSAVISATCIYLARPTARYQAPVLRDISIASSSNTSSSSNGHDSPLSSPVPQLLQHSKAKRSSSGAGVMNPPFNYGSDDADSSTSSSPSESQHSTGIYASVSTAHQENDGIEGTNAARRAVLSGEDV